MFPLLSHQILFQQKYRSELLLFMSTLHIYPKLWKSSSRKRYALGDWCKFFTILTSVQCWAIFSNPALCYHGFMNHKSFILFHVVNEARSNVFWVSCTTHFYKNSSFFELLRQMDNFPHSSLLGSLHPARTHF